MLTTCLYFSLAFSWCFDAKVSEPVYEKQVYELPVGKAVDFIAKYEAPNGPVLTAYLDTSGKYSIGYGSRSYEGETITSTEAYSRFLNIVRQSMKRVQKDFPNANDNQLVALVSVFYNCGNGYKKLKENGIEYHKTPGFCQLPGYSGLTKRRNAERVLLFGE